MKKKHDDLEELEEPFVSVSVVAYYDKIEETIETKPRGRTSKEWLTKINNLITACNTLAGRKIYDKWK